MKKSVIFASIMLFVSVFSAHGQSLGESNASVTPVSLGVLPSSLDGTSALFFWNNKLWTCVDHGKVKLYSLDTLAAAVGNTLSDTRSIKDMEEVAQDSDYLYLGDFGNNHYELRNNLRIYRLSKSELLEGRFRYDTIRFTYDGYDPNAPNEWTGFPITDFDCEAFIVAGDSLYLFTKQWSGQQTVCYAMPKAPGSYTAEALRRFNTQGMVTGVSYLPEKRLLAMVGYNSICQPFVQLLYGFDGNDFFGGQKQRISLELGMGHQMEGIASLDGEHYFLTNEMFSKMGVTRNAQLWSLDLSDLLHDYLYPDTGVVDTSQVSIVAPEPLRLTLTPNPAEDWLQVRVDGARIDGAVLVMVDSAGREVLRTPISSAQFAIDLQGFPKGVYAVVATTPEGSVSSQKIILAGMR